MSTRSAELCLGEALRNLRRMRGLKGEQTSKSLKLLDAAIDAVVRAIYELPQLELEFPPDERD